eukprot:m.248591 g.248591  ORF g.248591 m.248591 type:complete len:568 (-) comp15767_c0_seq1:140-1843(-)
MADQQAQRRLLDARAEVREGLAQNDPQKFIDGFQTAHGLREASCLSVLNLLDLHMVPRSKVYASILEHLSAKLISRIATLNFDQLKAMLPKTYPYVSSPELRAVPFGILQRMCLLGNIPVDVSKSLAETPRVFELAPIEIKRQVWEANSKLFTQTMLRVLRVYCTETPYAAMNMDDLRRVLPQARYHDSALVSILDLIGQSKELYNSFLAILRTQFFKGAERVYCTLRADALMALHEAAVAALYQVDPCHKLTWCTAACMREGTMDLRRAQDLMALVEAHKDTAVIGDAAMVLGDPFATQMLTATIVRALGDSVTAYQLPAESELLGIALRLRSLGESAVDILKNTTFSLPPPSPQLVTVFLPLVAAMMVKDRLTAAAEPRVLLDCPAGLWAWMADPIASRVILHYAFERAEAGELERVAPLLGGLWASAPDQAVAPTFLVPMCTSLAHWSHRLAHDDLTASLFDRFFVPAAAVHAAVRVHALQLLVLGRASVQSTLLSRLCRQLLGDPDRPAEVGEDAAMFSMLAEYVPDAATRAVLTQRAALLAPPDNGGTPVGSPQMDEAPMED